MSHINDHDSAPVRRETGTPSIEFELNEGNEFPRCQSPVGYRQPGPSTVSQHATVLQQSLENRAQVGSVVLQLQHRYGNHYARHVVAQCKRDQDEPTESEKRRSTNQVSVRQSRRTGLPEELKLGIENLSGVSMDGVVVHYDSPEPGKIDAFAYAQGKDIHIAPGQERQLPHEAWHVVQQSQRRVKPTVQLNGLGINNSATLEREADQMGARAYQQPPNCEIESTGMSAGPSASNRMGTHIVHAIGPASNIAGSLGQVVSDDATALGQVVQLSISGRLAGHPQWVPGGNIAFKNSLSQAGGSRKPLLEIGPNAGGFTLHVHLEYERPITAMSGWNLKDRQKRVVASEPNGRQIISDQDIAFLTQLVGNEDWLKPSSYGIRAAAAGQPQGERAAMDARLSALEQAATQSEANLRASEDQLPRDQETLAQANAALEQNVSVSYTWKTTKKSKGTTAQRSQRILKQIPELTGARADKVHVNNKNVTLHVIYDDVAAFDANHVANEQAIGQIADSDFAVNHGNVVALTQALADAQAAVPLTTARIQQLRTQWNADRTAYNVASAPRRNQLG